MFRKLLATLAVALMTLLAPSSASAAECTLYEQSHPAFTLDGSHLSTGKCSTCASCHIAGVFVGTPKSCVTCHNGDPSRITVARSNAHIPTGLLECNNCHNTTSFTATWNMNHDSVSTLRCDTCHNGNYVAGYNAQFKSAGHVPTTSDCGTCHQSRTNWTVNHADLHAGVTTNCVKCHDGVYAIGKSSYAPGHPVTSDQCETCHSINNNFKCAMLGDRIMKNLAWLRQKVETVLA